MTTLLDAARQALPGLEWAQYSFEVFTYVNGRRASIYDREDLGFKAELEAETSWFDTPKAAAQWLRAQVTARRDALDAALGEIDRVKLKTIVAAATERATALSRAGLGTVEPWAQAGQVLREIAGQMLDCLRGEDVPAVVLIPADDWVPVTERLPGDLLDKIVVDRQGYVFASRKVLPYDSNRWKDIDGETVTTDITHWRPLPAPPVVSKTERSEDA